MINYMNTKNTGFGKFVQTLLRLYLSKDPEAKLDLAKLEIKISLNDQEIDMLELQQLLNQEIPLVKIKSMQAILEAAKEEIANLEDYSCRGTSPETAWDRAIEAFQHEISELSFSDFISDCTPCSEFTSDDSRGRVDTSSVRHQLNELDKFIATL